MVRPPDEGGDIAAMRKPRYSATIGPRITML